MKKESGGLGHPTKRGPTVPQYVCAAENLHDVSPSEHPLIACSDHCIKKLKITQKQLMTVHLAWAV